MKVLVFGATGATGRHTVAQAIGAGHQVTAFARDPSASIGGARMVYGDATDPAAVAAALEGQQAVVSTIGLRNTLRSGGLIERSFRAIVPAMEQAGVRRLVLMSALGVGETRSQAPWLPQFLYRVLLDEIFGDKASGERIVQSSTLDWTIVYPPLLTNGPLTKTYRVGETLALSGMPKIARADVAHFMVLALAAHHWIGKRVIVST